MLIAILDIVFKYVIDGKQIIIKRHATTNKVTGYSFRSLELDKLLADKSLQELIAKNATKSELRINHGKAGSNWVDKKNNNQLMPIHRDFFYVGMDTRVEFTDTASLVAVE